MNKINLIRALLVVNLGIILFLLAKVNQLIQEYGFPLTAIVVFLFSYSGIMGARHLAALDKT